MSRDSMGKNNKIHHIIILHGLPGILNVLHILNLMMYGLVISQPEFFLMGLNSLQKSIPTSPARLLNELWQKISANRKIFNYIIIIITLILFLLVNHSIENIFFVSAILIILVLITRLPAIQKNNLPVHQTFHCRL
jgi:hypothetical protein